jgi:predicted O-linked N-acetylglucosamine transferase (SPINDLY family)
MDIQAILDQGIELHQAGQLEGARECYQQILKADKSHFDGLQLLGAIAAQMKQYDEAIELMKAAISVNSNNDAVFNNLGNVYYELRCYAKAIECIQRAIHIQPSYPEPYNNLGNVLHKLGRNEEAIECFQRAIHIQPSYSEPYNNLGNVLRKLGRNDDALTYFKQAIAIQPFLKLVYGNYLHAKLTVGDWTDLDLEIENLISYLGYGSPFAAPFDTLTFVDSIAIQKQAAENLILGEGILNYVGNYSSKRSTQEKKKLRVGYFSADFSEHPVMYLMAGFLEKHNKSDFEIYGFSSGPNVVDSMRLRINPVFEKFIDISQKADYEVVAIARDLQIDIAVDLSGHTGGGRMGVFALRAAPIQVNYLGFSGTMGAAFYDYIVADEILIPQEQQKFYSEKIAYLPHSYMPNDMGRRVSETPFTREEFGLRDGDFVFCCFNNSYKFNPKMFEVWMRLLKTVQNSVLWISENNPSFKKNIITNAKKNGVSADRIIFAGRMDKMEDHLARQKLADLFLDTYPYNAHTTAADALMVGLPLLTMAGESFTSRVAASLLHELGLDECITSSYDAYEKRALKFAMNVVELTQIREKLASNICSSAAFNPVSYAKNIEDLYKKMYGHYQADLRPNHLYQNTN